MGNLSGFDANQFEPNTFEVLPPGDYKAIIINSKMEDTKKKDGKFLKIQIQIVDGPKSGFKGLFDRLNLDNPNQQAVEIAKKTLSAICRAAGKMTPKDSSELHSIPIIVAVAVESRKDNGQPTNVIKGYKKIESPSMTPTLSQAGVASPVAPAPATAPWLTKR